MIQAIAFDLGGTFMEYTGMPLSWVEYYMDGFRAINAYYGCAVKEEALARSVEIMQELNPRFSYRETELSPEYIFDKALAHWPCEIPAAECGVIFFEGLNLKAKIYPDTVPVLKELQRSGVKTAALTDLPSAMPDNLFKKDIAPLLDCFDLYVSSAVCGFRKPNKKGLQLIAENFSLPMSDILFVGDEEKDQRTAENAGCPFAWLRREKGDTLSSVLVHFL